MKPSLIFSMLTLVWLLLFTLAIAAGGGKDAVFCAGAVVICSLLALLNLAYDR
tara:strand:+ start:58 stop:216 length:159 start_codon:yes stop_codon:yes gene_type:complete